VDDFTEGYFRLTAKTLRMLKWFVQTFENSLTRPDFLVKTDHDVFINVPNLVSHLSAILRERKESTGTLDSSSWYYIGGQKYTKPDMDLNPKSKFHISPKFWLNDTTPYYLLLIKYHTGVGKTIYPDYVGGPCYVLSGNIVPRLYEASFSVPLFPFEDLYLTGFVGHQYLKMTVSDIPGFTTRMEEVKQMLEDDNQLRKAIALHPAEPPALISTIYYRTQALMKP
jgi:hypothetical protein